VAEEVIRGDRKDPTNPFQWYSVKLNLPGPGYDPTMAWVMKLREDSRLASDLFTFVDDERLTGVTEELTWQAGHTLGAKQAYLGIQDAARKVGECSQQPRAWAGAVVYVVPGIGVCVLTSEEKWDKLKVIIEKWLSLVEAGATMLNHKELLTDRGFMVMSLVLILAWSHTSRDSTSLLRFGEETGMLKDGSYLQSNLLQLWRLIPSWVFLMTRRRNWATYCENASITLCVLQSREKPLLLRVFFLICWRSRP
jgi:hypothetical protein